VRQQLETWRATASTGTREACGQMQELSHGLLERFRLSTRRSRERRGRSLAARALGAEGLRQRETGSRRRRPHQEGVVVNGRSRLLRAVIENLSRIVKSRASIPRAPIELAVADRRRGADLRARRRRGFETYADKSSARFSASTRGRSSRGPASGWPPSSDTARHGGRIWRTGSGQGATFLLSGPSSSVETGDLACRFRQCTDAAAPDAPTAIPSIRTRPLRVS